jgi:hypothetical protein
MRRFALTNKSIFAAAILVSLFALSTAKAASGDESSFSQYLAPLEAKHTTEAERKGLEIYKKQYLMDRGWGDMQTTMDMTLIDALGNQSHRKVVKRMLQEGDAPDKTMGIFLQPADVRGTVMLTFEHSYGPDEQWLYLPSIKRTKKINAENKSGSFLGTEFSWEDISTTELTKYHYKYLRDDGNTWIVERTPTYEFSGYSREVTAVNKDNYQTVRIEYYDKKDTLLKTLTLSNWEQYKGKYWRPLHFDMVNVQNKKKTVLVLSPYKVGMGVDKRGFSSLGLSRIDISRVD